MLSQDELSNILAGLGADFDLASLNDSTALNNTALSNNSLSNNAAGWTNVPGQTQNYSVTSGPLVNQTPGADYWSDALRAGDPNAATALQSSSTSNTGTFTNGAGVGVTGTGGSFGAAGDFGAGGGCPAPWINISLADGGTVKAGDIQPGMVVHTRHETTGEWGDYPVTIVRHGEDERWNIKFEDGREFVGTFNHPVMVNEGWVEIQHLKAGDKVLQPKGFAVVKSAEYFDRGPIVKIEVQDAHTYLTEGFLSHNKMMQDFSSDSGAPAYAYDLFDDYASGGSVSDDSGLLSTLPDTVKKVGAQANLGGKVAGWYEYDPATMQFKWHSNTEKTDTTKDDADVVTNFIKDISGHNVGAAPSTGEGGDPNSYSNGLTHAIVNLGQLNNAPIVDASSFPSVAAAEAQAAADAATSASAPTGLSGVANYGGEGGVGGEGGEGGEGGGRGDGSVGGGDGPGAGGDGGGHGEGGGHGDARGGFFSRGKFNYRPDHIYASGGLSDALYNLGSYSDGGRLLKGPGDGVSDDIPATIGHGQPARLADGEFVIPARIVSELGNGSTDAGARKLYAMMDRIQAARKQTVGKGKVATNSRAEKYLPR